MKGRALLHHNVQLDDRATLSSVPGVKDGTILRVDKQVSQVKNKTTGKKTVMSGDARSAVDEDVVESIERSGDDEETSSENERRMSSSKRKRPSRTSTAVVGDFIDDNITNPSRGMALVPDGTSEDPSDIADTNLRKSTMALHLAKKKKRENIAREQAGILASEARILGRRLHSTFASPPKNPVESSTASARIPKTIEAISSHQDVTKDDEAIFLAGIDAAAAETERLPLCFEVGPHEEVSALRCNACRRTCGCGGDPLATLNSVVPVKEGLRGLEAAFTKSNSNGHLTANRNSTSQRAESSWTGM